MERSVVRMALFAVSLFNLLAGLWLGVMYFVLQHPGYLWRALMALGFVGMSVATLASLARSHAVAVRVLLLAGALWIGWIGLSTLAENLSASTTHFEGFAVIIGAALVVQSVLTLSFVVPPIATSVLHGRSHLA